jgi:hypothetical protein
VSDNVLKVELNYAITADMTADEQRILLEERMCSQGRISRLVVTSVSPFYSEVSGIVTDLVLARDIDGLKEFRTKMGAACESLLEMLDEDILEITGS